MINFYGHRNFHNGIFCALALSVLVSIAGCDSGIYSAEKRFWHATKSYDRLVKKGDKATAVDFQKVIDSLREITIRYPNWPSSAQAQFNIGQLYTMQGNYSKAKDEFGVITKDYPDNSDMCSKALFAVAVIYETEGNWPKALESLNKAESGYPSTGVSLQIPIYIARYYKAKGMAVESEAAYLAAAEKYKKMIKDNPKTYGALMAVDFASACYSDREKWDEDLDYLGGLVSGYPDTILVPKALFIKAAIYEQKLNQPEKAREIYSEITEKYTKTPFAVAAAQRIKILDKSK